MELRALARLLDTERERTLASLQRVHSRLTASSWSGPDARRFARRWQGERTRIRAALGSLAEAAQGLRDNASEQDRASDASGAAAPISGSASTSDAATGSAGSPAAQGNPAARMTATPADPGPPPVGEPLPAVRHTYEIGGGLSSGVSVDGSAGLVIEELADGRSMVWLEDRDRVGVSGGLSAGVDLGDLHFSGGGDASFAASVETRQGWIVDSEDANGLLARLGLREFSGAGVLSPGIPGDVGVLGRLMVAPVVELFGLGAPEPQVTDHTVSLGASLGLGAAAGVPLLGWTVGTLGAMGTRERPGTTSVVFSLQGSGHTAGPAGRIVGGPSGSGSVLLEVPLGGEGPQHAVVTRTRSVDGGEVVTRSVHEFGTPEVAEVARRALAEVLSGQHRSGARSISAVLESIDPEPVWSDSMGGVVEDDVHTADLGIALGADLGGSVTAGHRVVTYRR